MPVRDPEGRLWSLAFRGMPSAVLVQAIVLQAAFQAAVDPDPTTHQVGTNFSGFVSRRYRAAKPQEFVPKTRWPAESQPAARIGYPTKGQVQRDPEALPTGGQGSAGAIYRIVDRMVAAASAGARWLRVAQ
jgi:hypothetical protein